MSAQSKQIQTPDWITAILEEFEAAGFFYETTVASRIIAARDIEALSERERKAARAEVWAFQFRPHSPGQQSRWKTHFGPEIDVEGLLVPDVAHVDSPIIEYWAGRMVKAKHPLLRARYADLVWDLSRTAVAQKPSVDAARIAADSYTSSAELADAYNAPLAFERAERGLVLALSIGDQSRAAMGRDALFELSKRINEPIGWGALFDILERQDKVAVSADQLTAIVAGLEAFVAKANGDPTGCDPIPALHVTARLVRLHQRLGHQADADRVVIETCKSIERRASSVKHAVAHAWLAEVFRFYRINGLDREAERVQIEARKRGEQAQEEMETVSFDVEVPPDQLEAFLNGMTDGGLERALTNIVAHYIPDLDELCRQAESIATSYPLTSHLPFSQLREGQIVGNIGPPSSDREGTLIRYVSEDIGYKMMFLAKVFDRTWERYAVTPEQLVSFLYQSPSFAITFRGIIQLGIEAYFANDHPKAIHLLVPQIENSLRFLLTLVGRPPNKARRGDASSMTEKTLTDILEHESMVKDKFGDAVHVYLTAFLADPRGRNLRNRMSHGLMAAEEFHRGVSDRVLHILLMLGTVRRLSRTAFHEAHCQTATLAYSLWDARGKPLWDDQRDWFEAEKILGDAQTL